MVVTITKIPPAQPIWAIANGTESMKIDDVALTKSQNVKTQVPADCAGQVLLLFGFKYWGFRVQL